jgi:hypothetical protein
MIKLWHATFAMTEQEMVLPQNPTRIEKWYIDRDRGRFFAPPVLLNFDHFWTFALPKPTCSATSYSGANQHGKIEPQGHSTTLPFALLPRILFAAKWAENSVREVILIGEKVSTSAHACASPAALDPFQ